MSAGPLATTRQRLLDRALLVAMLGKDATGRVAIYTGQWSPTGALRPYLLLNYRTTQAGHWAMRSGSMTFDIFTDGPSTVRAEAIRDQIVSALDSEVLEDEAHLYRFSALAMDGPVPTEKPETVHWNLSFTVRYFRQELVLERVGGDP